MTTNDGADGKISIPSAADEKKDRRAIRALDSALDALKNYGTRKRQTEGAEGNSGDMFMTLGQAQAFLTVALNEGKNLKDLAEVNDTPQSTISRHLLDLGLQDRNRKPGFNLIDGSVDPMNLRQKLYTLTPRGKALKAQLVKILED